MRRPFLARQERCAGRLGRHDRNLRSCGLDHLAGTGHRTAGAVTRDPVVEPSTGEIPQDFRACRMAVVLGVRRVFELPGKEPAVFGSEFLGPANHTRATLGGRRKNHFRAETAHDLATLDRKGLSHCGNKRVSFGSADHGKRNPRISRGCLDHCLPGLQRSLLLRVVDDGKGETILH